MKKILVAIQEEVYLPIHRVVCDMDRVGYPRADLDKIEAALCRLHRQTWEVNPDGSPKEPDRSIAAEIAALIRSERARAAAIARGHLPCLHSNKRQCPDAIARAIESEDAQREGG